MHSLLDEDFFKGTDRPSFLNSMGFENIWNDSLSPVTKEAIWKYIKSFFTIGVRVVQMPQDSLPLLDYIINN